MMKTLSHGILLAVSLLLFFSTTASATLLNQEEGILPNHSAEYVRTLNRNASTSADAAFYNPAGLAFMKEDGYHIMFSNQTVIAEREHTSNYHSIDYNYNGYQPTTLTAPTYMDQLPEKYYTDIISPGLPDFDIVYKGKINNHEFATFFDFSITQAAPEVKYPEGVALIDWGQNALFETMVQENAWPGTLYYARDSGAVRTEYYLSGTLGAAYKISDRWSAALGARYIYAKGRQTIRVINNYIQPVGDLALNLDYKNYAQNQMTLEWDVDTEYEGQGYGLIGGLHFQPIKKLDIGMRYEYYFPMTATKKTNRLIAPPHVEANGNVDIYKDGTVTNQAYWDDVNSDQGGGYQSSGGNGQSGLKLTYPQLVAVGVSYWVSDQVRIEGDGEITLRSAVDLDGVEEKFKTLGYKVGGCAEWHATPKLVLSAGYAYTDYGVKPEERDEIDTLLNNHSIGAGVGFAYNERLDINAGAFYVFYEPYTHEKIRFTDVTGPTYHQLTQKYDEMRYSIGFGITYHFGE